MSTPIANLSGVAFDQDQSRSFNLLGFDSDGTIVAYTVVTPPPIGTLSGTPPTMTYTPPNGFFGTTDFYYTVTDNDGNVSPQRRVTITIYQVTDDATANDAECKYDHMLFGKTNVVPTSALTSNTTPVTSLDWLKNKHRARLTRWTDLSNDPIQIEGTLDVAQEIDYFAIAGSNLPPDAEIQLELFSSATDTVDLVGMTPVVVGETLAENCYVFAQWLNTTYVAQKWRLSIFHRYAYVAPTDPPPTIISDNTPKQEANGQLIIEAENAASEAVGSDAWQQQADALASNGQRMAKLESPFYWNAFEGPRLHFEFTATQSGLHQIWLRIRSDHGTSIYTITPDGNNYTVFSGTTDILGQGWQWRNTRSINLTAGQRTTITIAARAQLMELDKIVVQPPSFAAPTGTGPAQSPDGETIITSGGVTVAGENVSLRMLLMGKWLSLSKNFAYGTRYTGMTQPQLFQPYSGYYTAARGQQKIRQFSGDFPNMSDNDRRELIRLEQALKGEPLMINPYPERNREEWFTGHTQYLAYFADALEYTHWNDGRHSTQFRMLEA